MAQCVDFIDNVLTAIAVSNEDCTGFVLMSAFEYAQLAVGYEITPESIAYVWAWGFGSILSPWAVSYGILWAKKTIKSI